MWERKRASPAELVSAAAAVATRPAAAHSRQTIAIRRVSLIEQFDSTTRPCGRQETFECRAVDSERQSKHFAARAKINGHWILAIYATRHSKCWPTAPRAVLPRG